MNVSGLKEAVLLCREADITPFVWGKHGIGKSKALEQLCDVLGIGLVDMRCSQMEASDLRGLPDREMIEDPEGNMVPGRTSYLPPADLPHPHKCSPSCSLFRKKHLKHEACIAREQQKDPVMGCQGILFLDELNRGEDDVLQAAFQLVYDKAIGTYELPRRIVNGRFKEGWSIVVAGNYTEGYTVNSFNDPAFLDRFCHLDLVAGDDSYMEDWSSFMKTKGYDDPDTVDKIIQFCAFNRENLVKPTEADLGISVGQTPRSWEMAANVVRVARGGFDNDIKIDVLAGIIGRALALSFDGFSAEVTPRDVIENFKHHEDKVKRMSRNQLIGLVWGVASTAKDLGEKQGDKEKMNHVLDFMKCVASHKTNERDMAVMLARQLCAGETKSLGGAVVSNPHLAKMAAKFKTPKKGKRTWIAAINDRPNLQDLMSKVSFGTAE